MKFARIFSLLFLTVHLCAGNYAFEGVFKDPDGEERFFLATCFLPYNPTVLALGCIENAAEECSFWWPKSTFFSTAAQDQNYDFVWIESDGSELEILQGLSHHLSKTSVIYTATHHGSTYANLRLFLEMNGFNLLSHWYWEGGKGNAIFVKKELFDGAMKTLNYAPKARRAVCYPGEYDLQRFFKKAESKLPKHTYGSIDFIYMINLDERPEKFALAASGLAHFGIYPYRFSAVNGWKLPLDVIDQLGVKFPIGSLKEKFMGTVYHGPGTRYRSNQIIVENGETYFSMGLSLGSIGIVLSHLSVLQDAYDAGYETIWVMEDDVEVVGDPGQLAGMIRTLDELAPDWDILFTDTDTKDTKGVHVPCRAIAARPNYRVEILHTFLQRFYPISSDLSRIGMRYGAYSMIVRRSGMKKILDYFQSYGIFLPYDMDFWLIPDIKMYSVNADIISHAAGAHTDNNFPNYTKKP